MTNEPRITFHALPNCPHLEWTYSGYTLLNLAGLHPRMSEQDVKRITINGVEPEWKPWRHNVVMIIPALRQEAQRIAIYGKEVPEPRRAFNPFPATGAPAKRIDGYTGASSASRGPNQRGF
jgi:hypothetical protein